MDNLSEGETVIYEGHPSWRSILAFYVKGLGIAIVVGLLAALIAGGHLHRSPSPSSSCSP